VMASRERMHHAAAFADTAAAVAPTTIRSPTRKSR
jgi:hypothetical protein